MEIALYRYTGERNLIDKSADLVLVETLRGDIKGDMDVLNPTILITLTANADGSYKDFNYFWITETKRFYFVTSITLSSKNLMMVTGQVDPLYTYMDEIMNQSVFVERNEFEYDEMLPDSLMPFANDELIAEYIPEEIENSKKNFSFVTDFNPLDYTKEVRNVVITTISDYSIAKSSATHGLIVPPYDGMPRVDNYDFFTTGNECWAMNQLNFSYLTDDLKRNSVARQYVLNTMVFPFELPKGVSIDLYTGRLGFEYYLADDNGTITQKTFLSKGNATCIFPLSDYLILSEFRLPTYANFDSYEPYTSFEIYLPLYGWLNLDLKARKGHYMMVFYTCEYTTGKGMVHLYDVTRMEDVFYSPVMMGMGIPLNVTNYEQMQNQAQAIYQSSMLGIIGNVVGVAGNAVAGNYGKAITSMIGAVGNVVAHNNAVSQIYPQVKSELSSGGNNLFTPMEVRIRYRTRVRLNINLTSFAHDFGRPLMQYRALSSMAGFTKALSAHVTGIEATREEIASIESALMSGVYI